MSTTIVAEAVSGNENAFLPNMNYGPELGALHGRRLILSVDQNFVVGKFNVKFLNTRTHETHRYLPTEAFASNMHELVPCLFMEHDDTDEDDVVNELITQGYSVASLAQTHLHGQSWYNFELEQQPLSSYEVRMKCDFVMPSILQHGSRATGFVTLDTSTGFVTQVHDLTRGESFIERGSDAIQLLVPSTYIPIATHIDWEQTTIPVEHVQGSIFQGCGFTNAFLAPAYRETIWSRTHNGLELVDANDRFHAFYDVAQGGNNNNNNTHYLSTIKTITKTKPRIPFSQCQPVDVIHMTVSQQMPTGARFLIPIYTNWNFGVSMCARNK